MQYLLNLSVPYRIMIQILQESCKQIASDMYSLPRLNEKFLQDFEFFDHKRTNNII